MLWCLGLVVQCQGWVWCLLVWLALQLGCTGLPHCLCLLVCCVSCAALSPPCCSEKQLSIHFNFIPSRLNLIVKYHGWVWPYENIRIVIRRTLVKADGDSKRRRGIQYKSCSSYTEDDNTSRPRYTTFNIKPVSRLRLYLHQDFNNYGLHLPRMLSSITWELCSAVAQYACWYSWWCGAWALGCFVGWVSLPLAWLGPRTAFSLALLLYVFGTVCDE